MRSRCRLWMAVAATAVVVGVSTGQSGAETNAGFTASLSGQTLVPDAQVGETINFGIDVAGVVSAKQAEVAIAYDPRVIEIPTSPAPGVAAGPFFPQVFIVFQEAPVTRPDGLEVVSAGGAQLGAPSPGSGAGTIFTVTCRVIGEVPDEGTAISIVRVRLNVTSTDSDTLVFEPGELAVALTRSLPNGVFDFAIERRHNGAVMTWRTALSGVDDAVRYWAIGSSDTLTAQSPLRSLATAEALDELATLRALGRELRSLSLEEASLAVGRPVTAEDFRELRALDEALIACAHTVTLRDLVPDTRYGYELLSTSLSGHRSPRLTDVFRTRRGPDRRPVAISQVLISSGGTNALISWRTNRLADTRILVETLDPGGAILDTVLVDTTNLYGTTGHTVRLANLVVGNEYRATMGSRLIEAEALLADGGMSEAAVGDAKVRLLRAQPSQPLRFIGQPRTVAGAQRLRLKVDLNQPAWVVLEYGLVDALPAKATALATPSPSSLYPEKRTSGEPLSAHEFGLTSLVPGAEYRYRVTAYLDGAGPWSEGEPLNSAVRITTDPQGEEQWSRDLRFRTSTRAPQAPVFTQGPQITGSGSKIVIRWDTDVPSFGAVYVGTLAGDVTTLGTGDEWEYPDLNQFGVPRIAREHVVTLTGLEPGVEYGFRVESVAINGMKAVFDPLGSLAAAGKVAKLAQPPGGAGRFTTGTTPDTQWPVLLSGPAVSSKTHDTAVIEWTTDEPADSEIRFGTATFAQYSASSESNTNHKMVITNLRASTTYKYVVGSTDPSGNGATESSEAAFTTDPETDVQPPRIVDGPAVVYKNDRSATIRWVTDEDATAEARYGTTPSLGIVRSTVEVGVTHEVTLTNLLPSTQYYARVYSTDLSWNGPTESETLSFVTDDAADLTPPVISEVVAVPADSSTLIVWTTDEPANSYVEYGTDPLGLDQVLGSVHLVTSHQMALVNLTPTTTYYYRVGSVDRANNAAVESELAAFTTTGGPDLTPPSVPTDLVAVASNRQVSLTWGAVLELDLNGFNVYRRTGSEAFARVASCVRDNQYTDLNVTNNETYEYQVTAIDRRNPPNESAPSATVSATPRATIGPSAPSNLSYSAENHLRPVFVFTNATPYVAGATLTYTLQVSTDASFSTVTASVTGLAQGSGGAPAGQTAWAIDRNLTAGGLYYWRVRAVEGSLLGPFATSTVRAVPHIAGDFDGSGVVDFDDFFSFVDAFGMDAVGDLVKFDLSQNGKVDFDDFFIFVDNFGRSAWKRFAREHPLDESTIIAVEAIGGTRVRDQGALTVRITASELADVRAYGLVLRYDPQVVEWLDGSPGGGPLVAAQGMEPPLFRVTQQRPGELVILNGGAGAESASGTGLLAELRFQVLGQATNTTFQVADALLAASGDRVRRVVQLGSAALVPSQFYLGANYPNPFNPETSIEYGLPTAGPVELAVYDVLGQPVRILVRTGSQPAGYYTAHWDGRDDSGRLVGSGVYLCRLQASGFTRTQKVALVK